MKGMHGDYGYGTHGSKKGKGMKGMGSNRKGAVGGVKKGAITSTPFKDGSTSLSLLDTPWVASTSSTTPPSIQIE